MGLGYSAYSKGILWGLRNLTDSHQVSSDNWNLIGMDPHWGLRGDTLKALLLLEPGTSTVVNHLLKCSPNSTVQAETPGYVTDM